MNLHKTLNEFSWQRKRAMGGMLKSQITTGKPVEKTETKKSPGAKLDISRPWYGKQQTRSGSKNVFSSFDD